jgi:hypothetical protein
MQIYRTWAVYKILLVRASWRLWLKWLTKIWEWSIMICIQKF